MSKVLAKIGLEYENDNIINASYLFSTSAKLFEKLCEIFIDYLLSKTNDIISSKEILLNIANIEYRAYSLISKGIC